METGHIAKTQRTAQAEDVDFYADFRVVAPTPTRGRSGTDGMAADTLALKGKTAINELTDGPYLEVATWLDASALCAVDSSCQQLRHMNRTNCGPWRALGAHCFYGMELERDGVFEPTDRGDSDGSEQGGGRKMPRLDWKGRYSRFRSEVAKFRQPFDGSKIAEVRHPDEVAYCRCRLRTDFLDGSIDKGVYLEVEVKSNPDNLSLAVVDFEAGGRSSVTFSPDTGAVIRERKVREAPRKVEGAYIQPLSTTPSGRRFEGSMGLYLQRGNLAFFRRYVVSSADGEVDEVGPWESTGFITDLAWAEGQRLTPCLAFRDEGNYSVRIVQVGPLPPQLPQRTTMAYEERSWNALDWEAGQPADQEV